MAIKRHINRMLCEDSIGKNGLWAKNMGERRFLFRALGRALGWFRPLHFRAVSQYTCAVLSHLFVVHCYSILRKQTKKYSSYQIKLLLLTEDRHSISVLLFCCYIYFRNLTMRIKNHQQIIAVDKTILFWDTLCHALPMTCSPRCLTWRALFPMQQCPEMGHR